MISILKKIMGNKTIYIVILIAILYIPSAIYLPAESNRRLVVAAVGLDKEQNEIEVSLLMVIPKSSGNVGNNYQLISRTGENLASALKKIGIATGKEVSFAHCEMVIVSNGILENDLATYLDFFIRSNNLTSNADLVASENAKETLHANMLFATEYSITLKDIFTNDKKITGATNLNIDSFFKSYLNEGNCFFIPFIKIDKPSNESAGSSSSENSGSSGGGNESENTSGASGEGEAGSNNGKNKIVSYDGSYLILKDGKNIAYLDGSSNLGYLAINPNVKKGVFQIENVTDTQYNNSTLNFEILEKKIKKDIQFIDNKPFVTYNIFLFIKLEEIFSEPFNKNSLNTVKTIIHKPTLDKLTETIDSSISNLLKISKENKVDVFNVINDSCAHCYTNYKNYLNSKPKEDLINDAIVVCNYEFAVRN